MKNTTSTKVALRVSINQKAVVVSAKGRGTFMPYKLAKRVGMAKQMVTNVSVFMTLFMLLLITEL